MSAALPDIERIAALISGGADVAIILGSGLGKFADSFADSHSISTADLPGYPQSTVAGHAGRIVTGKIGNTRMMAFQGRVHIYEGYTPEVVVTPVRLAHQLGIRTLIVTNASGSFTKKFAPGDLLLIEDHINLQFRNPLLGLWDLNVRCPDVCYFYDPDLAALAERIALELQIPLKRGTLAALTGPTYESRAEARMLARIGADAGCMSTVPEVITATALGMRVLGISCVTNYSSAIPGGVQNHEDVQKVAAEAGVKFGMLLKEVIGRIKEQGTRNK